MEVNERCREKYPISQVVTAKMQSRSQRKGAGEALRDAQCVEADADPEGVGLE